MPAAFTELQRAAINRAARAHRSDRSGDAWIRSVTAGDRVTFASLERRGIFERRAWRGDGVSRDSAFEYRLAAPIRRELDRRELA